MEEVLKQYRFLEGNPKIDMNDDAYYSSQDIKEIFIGWRRDGFIISFDKKDPNQLTILIDEPEVGIKNDFNLKPKCANINCYNYGVERHTTKTGKISSHSLCSSCLYYKNKPEDLFFKRGVIQIKKNFCENQDGRLGWTCSASILSLEQLALDHIDGNHFNNDPTNIQTICHNCHILKGAKCKDFIAGRYC